MHCPFCSFDDTKVIDSRVNELEVRRRRECDKCTKRFTTYEKAEIDLIVKKKDGHCEEFSKDKIKEGILKACHKRPINAEQIEQVVSKVEQKARNTGKWEVKSSVLGRLVMKELMKIDQVAYLRYASVCKAFDNPTHFSEEVALLKVN